MKKRSGRGSEKRRRAKIIRIRVDEKEESSIKELAEKRGISPPALLRLTLLNVPPGRSARRARVNDRLMAQFLAQLAGARDVLKSSVAELGKSGSNLNQIAHVLNTDRTPESVMNILRDTLESHFEAIEEHKQAVRDLEELRTAGMNAMGLELRHGTAHGDE